MLSKLVHRSLLRFSSSHSFYASNTLEYPINLSEEGYANNRKLMEEVNSAYSHILKQVFISWFRWRLQTPKWWKNSAKRANFQSGKESKNSSIQDHHSWSSQHLQGMSCMERRKSTQAASSQVLVLFTADSAWLLLMIRQSKGTHWAIQRNLLSNHSQEASQSTGNCSGKQTALLLPCRLRRSELASPERRVSCRRPLWKNFLQHGPAFGPGNSPDFSCVGQLYCRWSLRPRYGWWKHYC